MFGCIRVATRHDAKAIAEIYEPYVRDTAISFEHTPPTPWDMEDRIGGTLRTHPWLVFEDGAVYGYAYAAPFRSREAYRWATEVSVYIRDGFHRKGIGTALSAFLLHLLERQRYGAAFAGITLPNRASVALFEALGFEPAGVFRRVGYKLGRWHDVGWWQRSLIEPTQSPSKPIPFAELVS